MTAFRPSLTALVSRPSTVLGAVLQRAARPPMTFALAVTLSLALGAGAAHAAPAQPLDANQARAEVAAGTVVWDLRSSGPVLPGALRVEPAALQAWLGTDDVQALAQAVSAAGVNLAGRVLLVADADDAATALTAARLARLSRGSVAWLQGGLPAWQAQGLPLQDSPSTRLPLPQRLVALGGFAAEVPADAARRRTATFAMHEPTVADRVVQAVQPSHQTR